MYHLYMGCIMVIFPSTAGNLRMISTWFSNFGIAEIQKQTPPKVLSTSGPLRCRGDFYTRNLHQCGRKKDDTLPQQLRKLRFPAIKQQPPGSKKCLGWILKQQCKEKIPSDPTPSRTAQNLPPNLWILGYKKPCLPRFFFVILLIINPYQLVSIIMVSLTTSHISIHPNNMSKWPVSDLWIVNMSPT